MRKIARAGAVVVAAAGATVGLPTVAAVATDQLPRGEIVICNHTGYMFGVFADGPSFRQDDLAGSFDECTDWSRVLPGSYDIGFNLRVPTTQQVILQVRVKRDNYVFYRRFNNEGITRASVGKDSVTRVDLFIPRA